MEAHLQTSCYSSSRGTVVILCGQPMDRKAETRYSIPTSQRATIWIGQRNDHLLIVRIMIVKSEASTGN